MQHSAEFYRGAKWMAERVQVDRSEDPSALIRAHRVQAAAMLAEAEAREAGEPDVCALAAAEELDMLALHIQQYIGPDDARDDIRRICYNRAKDLRRNAIKPREASVPTAGEVIEACRVWVQNAIDNAEYETEYDGQTLVMCHYCDRNTLTGEHTSKCQLSTAVDALAAIAAWESNQK